MLDKFICHPGGTQLHRIKKIKLTCLVKGLMLGLKGGYPDCAILVVFLRPSKTKVKKKHKTAHSRFLSRLSHFFVSHYPSGRYTVRAVEKTRIKKPDTHISKLAAA
jgi:hypothetical protein